MTHRPLIVLSAALLLCALSAAPAWAQSASVSSPIGQEASVVAKACLSNWQAPGCLKAVSGGALVLASNYGVALQQGGHAGEAEQVKQHCAASTAATQGNYPAYAMKSAFTECANTITDIAGKTGVQPDPAQFQLLVGPTLCLSGDPRCSAVETGLKAYAH
jgi:hypothetical protein